jgi:hypothetical protein
MVLDDGAVAVKATPLRGRPFRALTATAPPRIGKYRQGKLCSRTSAGNAGRSLRLIPCGLRDVVAVVWPWPPQLPNDDSSDDNRDDSGPLNYAPYSPETHLSCLVTSPARSWQCGDHPPLTWGPSWDHTLYAVMNDMRACARLARPQTGHTLAVTSGNALPLLTGGQVVQRLPRPLPNIGASGINAHCLRHRFVARSAV